MKCIGANLGATAEYLIHAAVTPKYGAELAGRIVGSPLGPSRSWRRPRQLAGKCSWKAGPIAALASMLSPTGAALEDTSVREDLSRASHSRNQHAAADGLPTVRAARTLGCLFAFATTVSAFSRTFKA